MVDWDKKYRERAGYRFGGAPNEYVRQVMARSDVDPRSALCLADGDGRNGAWLAGRGLRVTAVDFSSVATERALALDASRGVETERITADLADWTPPTGAEWDSVFLLYLHCHPTVRNRALAFAVEHLAPRGIVAIEGFAKPQATRAGMGPDNPVLLYGIDELTAVLPDLEIVEALSGEVSLAEGDGHRGLAAVVRLLLRKP